MLSDDLDELEHQALDRLDELEQVGEADAADREALERVSVAFDRLALQEASRLLEAAEALVLAEPERTIARARLVDVRSAIAEDPKLALALSPTVELIGLGLGLARERLAWALLVEQGERASARAPAAFESLSTELAALLREAWPRSGSGPPSLAGRVFRVQALGGGGPSVRARALAAEHPEHGKLAAALLAERPDASAAELVSAFDQARTRLDAAAADAETKAPAPELPKRRFTWVHALLAAIILALTLWHYLAR